MSDRDCTEPREHVHCRDQDCPNPTGEVISTAPLDVGDPVAIDTFVNQGTVLGGKPGDLVAIAVPEGKGLILEQWLRRQFFRGAEETDE